MRLYKLFFRYYNSKNCRCFYCLTFLIVDVFSFRRFECRTRCSTASVETRGPNCTSLVAAIRKLEKLRQSLKNLLPRPVSSFFYRTVITFWIVEILLALRCIFEKNIFLFKTWHCSVVGSWIWMSRYSLNVKRKFHFLKTLASHFEVFVRIGKITISF